MQKSIDLKAYAKQNELHESLVFRPIAKKIYTQALKDIGEINSEDIIDCDFKGIKMCDVSFADEFIINLQKKLLQINNSLLRLINIDECVSENIEAALMFRNKKERTKLCLLIYSNNKYSLIGELENNLNETFMALLIQNEITARHIAQQFAIEINSASNRLKKLFDLRLIMRYESIDENGKQHIYYLPK